MTRSKSYFIPLLVLAALPAAPAFAAIVESGDAARAAVAWVARNPAPLEDAFAGREAADVKTFDDDDGKPVFHVVELDGGGFVVTSADDELAPVVLFSASGENPDLEPGSPLFDFLARTMLSRTEKVRDRPARDARADADAEADASARSAAKAEWAALLAGAARSTEESRKDGAGTLYVSDVRVPKILGSKWNQEEVRGVTVYNYYTPYEYPCGCVATAMAQIMRFHRYPTGYVDPQGFYCAVDGDDSYQTMMGGYYNWDDMPLIPGGVLPSLSYTQRAAIGKLTYDCGVALRMDWGYDGSSAYTSDIEDALKDVFGYANAEYESSSYGFGTDGFQRLILANLDARSPVALSICSYADGYRESGHAIVADGYGYNGSTLYVHLNMGWAGSDDLWYAIPDIGTWCDFDTVDGVVYNIFPRRRGDIISGRVLSKSGRPVPGATVRLSDDYGSNVGSTTSNNKGIYFFIADPDRSYTVAASKGGSSNSTYVYLDSYDRNAWGQDLRLWEYEVPEQHVSLPVALDNTALTFTTGGYSKWFGRTARNSDGHDSAQSGPCANGKASWLTTKVSGPGTISFKWKTSSEHDFDWLEFWVDGKKKARISGKTGWLSKSVAIAGGGSHTLTWRYVKDGSVSEGEDCGWVDVVKWTSSISLPAALDSTLSFTTGGYAKWKGQKNVSWDGVDAARSGAVPNGKASWLTTTVRGSGTLTFHWMTSSEESFDWLELWVDGKKKARISGRTGWRYKSLRIPGGGTHTITWRYVKDGSVSEGSDAGWVDRVRWTR